MNGRITPVRPGMTAVRAIRAYLAKFPFVQEFFDEGQMLDLIGFSRRFRVKLYRFTPLRAYYLDNEVRFGFRTEVVFGITLLGCTKLCQLLFLLLLEILCRIRQCSLDH